MVVDDDRTSRGHADQRAEHLARMDLDAVDGAARDLDDIEHAVADIEADREEHFLLQTCEAWPDDAIDILGLAELLAVLLDLDRAAAELECGGDPGRALGT